MELLKSNGGNDGGGDGGTPPFNLPQPRDELIGIEIIIPAPIRDRKISICFSKSIPRITLPLKDAVTVRDHLSDVIKALETLSGDN